MKPKFYYRAIKIGESEREAVKGATSPLSFARHFLIRHEIYDVVHVRDRIFLARYKQRGAVIHILGQSCAMPAGDSVTLEKNVGNKNETIQKILY